MTLKKPLILACEASIAINPFFPPSSKTGMELAGIKDMKKENEFLDELMEGKPKCTFFKN